MTGKAVNVGTPGHIDHGALAGVSELKAMLAATGFELCEFGPEEGDHCEKCGLDNRQQYFRNTDVFSMDGDYWCLDCVEKLHSGNEADLAANVPAVRHRAEK